MVAILTLKFLWPKAIKRHMNKHGQATIASANESEDDIRLNYVYKILRQFRDWTTLFNNQLREIKHRLNNSFTLEMEETIDQFVEQQGTAFCRIPIEGEIAVDKFDYQDRVIEREFERQGPVEYQVSEH
jgi:hypothetical protein